MRLVNWLLLEYVLDVMAISSAGRHPVDSLLMTAISQANVAPVSHDIALQTAFAEAAAPPPDELRRPISTHALAQSLRMPFETVRRRVRALEKIGICVAVNGGVMVPAAVALTPEFTGRMAGSYARTRALYLDLQRYRALPSLPQPAVVLPAESRPLRVVSRATGDFVLRVADTTIEMTGSVMDAVLLLALIRANLAHLAPPVAGIAAWTDEGFFGDNHRRPARPAHLAAYTGFAAETVRRHARRLQEAGFCTATPDGLTVDQGSLARPGGRRVMQANLVSLDRMFAQLAEAGVLALWDQQEGAAVPTQAP